MKALGVLESKWDPTRKKLVRRLIEEQDKVLRSSVNSHKREECGARGVRGNCKGREHVQWQESSSSFSRLLFSALSTSSVPEFSKGLSRVSDYS